jgi:hypothetical protein
MADTKKFAFFDEAFHQGLEWGTPVLIDKFGEEKALALNQTMKEKYQELKPALPEMKTKTAQQLLIYAIRSSLLFKAIRDEMDQQEAFDLVADYGETVLDAEWMEGFSAVVRFLLKNRFLFPKVARLVREKMNRSNDPNGWQYEFLPTESGHLLDFNVTRCGMVKFLSDQGIPQLAPVICRLDYHMAENFLPKCARLVRTQTIAENASFCDFRYLKQ